MSSQLKKLKNKLAKSNFDSLFIIHPPNISYIVGFNVEESFLFIKNNTAFLITDFRYLEEYSNKLRNSPIKLLEIDKDIWSTLRTIKKHQKIKNLGFEKDYTSVSFYQKLKSVFPKLTQTERIIEDLRIIKNHYEIKLIKKALSIAKLTLNSISKKLKTGERESDISSKLQYLIRQKGLFNVSFEPIVAFGENSSFPHAKISKRKLRQNEPILIDMGVDYMGYKSDLTRMYFLGKMDPLFKKVLAIIKEAQQLAITAIKPGIPANSIDKKARNFIKQKGFGDNFRHSLGHGIGLEVHESPRINSKNNRILKPGMVFTIEPAIYLPNKFGVRIEDIALVTDKGAKKLS